MSDLKRELSEDTSTRTIMLAADKEGREQDQQWTQSSDVAYDALDYRLMATFPASDAVAQY